MIIVLDSNEYLYFLNKETVLLEKLFRRIGFFVHIHRFIISEVIQNIKETQEKEFYYLLRNRDIIINEEELPFELLSKYENLGLRKGDTIIALFCEKIKVDYLITENRDFLKSKKFNFQILSLQKFLEMFKLI